MSAIDPAAVKAEHRDDGNGFCWTCEGTENVSWPCEPYRLAKALASVGLLAQERCERFTSGDCTSDATLSPDARYGADRYCWPCRIRAALEPEQHTNTPPDDHQPDRSSSPPRVARALEGSAGELGAPEVTRAERPWIDALLGAKHGDVVGPTPRPEAPPYGPCGCSLYAICHLHEVTRPRGCTCHGPAFRSSSCPVSAPPGTPGHAEMAEADPDHDPAALD